MRIEEELDNAAIFEERGFQGSAIEKGWGKFVFSHLFGAMFIFFNLA